MAGGTAGVKGIRQSSRAKKMAGTEEKSASIITKNGKTVTLTDDEYKTLTNKNIEIVDCFHVGSTDLDVLELSKKYNCILNTKKI